MVKRTLFLAGVMLSALWTSASTVYNIRGTEFRADTLFHAQIGPGTTQTSLFMHADATNRDMYVYYAKVDLTNPYIVFRTVMGQDQINLGETVRSMSERKSEPGNRYFLGVNGDFFHTSGTSMRGVSMVGIPIGPCIVDGQIYKANTNSAYTQFVLDKDMTTPLIGSTTFSGKVKNQAGKQVNIGGVNLVNPGSSSNSVILFNNLFFKGTNVSHGTAEIPVKLVEGDEFCFGKTFRMEVIGEYSTDGDMDIPDDGYVLHARGTSDDFVKALMPGDTIEVEFHAKMDGKEFEPYTMMSSWPQTLKDGEVLETEYLLEEFGSNQPVIGVGFADGGKTIMFLSIDGRSAQSSGARTTETGDLMRQLGCTDALNMDSGGSATLYTSALGIRNVPSDGSERADGNGLFACYTAPDDSTVTSIQFIDWVAKVPKYGVYTPKFYGYNQYGVLVDTDVKGVTLSCSETVGVIQNGITFFGNGSGDGVIMGHCGEMTCSVPVQILGDGSGIAIKNDSIINDTHRSYQVEVLNTVDGVTLPIDPAVLSWRSTNEQIVAIDAKTGVLRGLNTGEAEVIGSVGDFSDTLKVIVEKPLKEFMPVEYFVDINTWKTSQTGGKDVVKTPNGGFMDYTYTGASGRAPKITLSKTIRLWSLPDELMLGLSNPNQAPIQSVVFGLRANGESMTYQTVQPDTISGEVEILTATVKMSDWLDADDMSKYPITLSSIQLNMGASTTGENYTIHFNHLFTTYYSAPANYKTGDVNGDGVVNVADVSALVNAILGIGSYHPMQIDVNCDGEVNVADVTALVNIVLEAK